MILNNPVIIWANEVPDFDVVLAFFFPKKTFLKFISSHMYNKKQANINASVGPEC